MSNNTTHTDWKGNRVLVKITHCNTTEAPGDADYEFVTHLDTDTLTDCFEQFPPADGWIYVILPYEEASETGA